MNQPPHALRSSVSRRSLALGAAWSIPAVIAAAPAASAASSVLCKGCWTLNWDSSPSPYNNDFTSHTGTTDWTRDGYLTPPTGVNNCGWITSVVSQQRSTGASMGPTPTTRNDTRGDFGIGWTPDFSTIATGGVAGLILNQATASAVTRALEYVTFEFYTPITSVSFTIYDFTSTTTSGAANNYIDAVGFDKSTTVTASGDTVGGNLRTTMNAAAASSQTTNSLTNYVYRAASFPTATTTPTATNGRNVDVTVSLGGATNFKMSYYNTGDVRSNSNDQWVVIGDLKVCNN